MRGHESCHLSHLRATARSPSYRNVDTTRTSVLLTVQQNSVNESSSSLFTPLTPEKSRWLAIMIQLCWVGFSSLCQSSETASRLLLLHINQPYRNISVRALSSTSGAIPQHLDQGAESGLKKRKKHNTVNRSRGF